MLLALAASELPLVAADCTPAVNSVGIISRHGTVEWGPNVCPMSAADKGKLFLRHTWSPMNFGSALIKAGYKQARETSHEGYGQGWNAFGSRLGAALANRETSDLLKTFIIPSAFHMDPRYFRKGSGSAGSRVAYAVSRVVVSRTDSGRATFNAPEVLGSFTAAGITNAYYPDSERTLHRTVTSALFNIGTDAAWNLLKEFGPEIRHKLGIRKKR